MSTKQGRQDVHLAANEIATGIGLSASIMPPAADNPYGPTLKFATLDRDVFDIAVAFYASGYAAGRNDGGREGYLDGFYDGIERPDANAAAQFAAVAQTVRRRALMKCTPVTFRTGTDVTVKILGMKEKPRRDGGAGYVESAVLVTCLASPPPMEAARCGQEITPPARGTRRVDREADRWQQNGTSHSAGVQTPGGPPGSRSGNAAPSGAHARTGAFPLPDPTLSARGRLNAYKRYRPADDPAIIEARRDLKALRAADYVRRLIDEAPPLTASQRDNLAVLLRPSGGDRAA